MPVSAVATVLRTRRVRPSRRSVALIAGVVVALWIVLAFGRALAALDGVNSRLAIVRAETTALETRLAQARAEAIFVQSPNYVRFIARAYGMGRPGERAFALARGAPSPPPVKPLGETTDSSAPVTPLDGWVRLLFGG